MSDQDLKDLHKFLKDNKELLIKVINRYGIKEPEDNDSLQKDVYVIKDRLTFWIEQTKVTNAK